MRGPMLRMDSEGQAASSAPSHAVAPRPFRQLVLHSVFDQGSGVQVTLDVHEAGRCWHNEARLVE